MTTFLDLREQIFLEDWTWLVYQTDSNSSPPGRCRLKVPLWPIPAAHPPQSVPQSRLCFLVAWLALYSNHLGENGWLTLHSESRFVLQLPGLLRMLMQPQSPVCGVLAWRPAFMHVVYVWMDIVSWQLVILARIGGVVGCAETKVWVLAITCREKTPNKQTPK